MDYIWNKGNIGRRTWDKTFSFSPCILYLFYLYIYIKTSDFYASLFYMIYQAAKCQTEKRKIKTEDNAEVKLRRKKPGQSQTIVVIFPTDFNGSFMFVTGL